MNIRFFFLGIIFGRTVIVPLTLKNHRLHLGDKPSIINSALHDEIKLDDHFKIPSDYSFLSNDTYSLCYKNNSNDVSTCSNEGSRKPWKLVDVTRQVRFKNIENKCLTVGNHNSQSDEYEVILTPCDPNNQKQIFILNGIHGTNAHEPQSAEVLKSETVIRSEPTRFGNKPKKIVGRTNFNNDDVLEEEVAQLLNKEKHSKNKNTDQTKPVRKVYSNGQGEFS